mmetsp:Transcript_14214/g.37679  ORF Transcript_14214/g.37679 Transcript_14214/m.37679 type:complete len:204 (-) Transcript_14214:48-659(-)
MASSGLLEVHCRTGYALTAFRRPPCSGFEADVAAGGRHLRLSDRARARHHEPRLGEILVVLVLRVLVLMILHLVPDHRGNHAQCQRGDKHAADDRRGNVDPLFDAELHADEDEDGGDRVRQQREQVHQLVHDEEHRAKAEHREDARGVGEEQVRDLRHDGGDRVDGEDHVGHLEADDDKEQARGAERRRPVSLNNWAAFQRGP